MSTIVACFEAQLAKAMQRVKIILDTTRNPQFAGDVPHVYEDKYLLADYLTNSMLAAEMTVLDFLGLNGEHRARIQGWQKAGQSVSLRFRASQACKLVRQADRKVESPSSTSHSVTVLGITASSTSKVVTTIHEWFWNIEAEWELLLFTGTDVEAALVLLQNKGQVEQITNSDRSPAPAVTAHPHIDVNITWLAQQLDDNGKFNFTIDRSVDSCRTPRRNVQIAAALTFNHELLMWYASIQRFFHDKHFPQQSQGSLQMSILSEHDLFVPILPLFEEANSDQSPSSQSSSLPAAPVTSSSPSSPSSSSSSSSSSSATPSGSDSEPQLLAESTASESSSVLLSRQDLQRFLTDNRAGIVGKLGELERLFPRDGRLITAAEALVCVLTLHGGAVGSIYLQSLEYIEGLLYKQLHAAIGKDVTPSDFAEYMRFHNRKLFREEFEPGMFCYAVRRPEHYPEGVLSIEATTTGLPEPILASSRRIEPSFPMSFALNAATSVTFHGERYAHAWINYSFEGQSGVSLALNARARQFSSFILLVGKVLSATQFEPTGAMIIQNKDDLSIPLLLEQIPTPKEFKDATASLSPEQRRFAKAYREMQLASTLFGVCIIQIKPQLEKLLRLPPDALTKEIKLTQDLLQLFIRYQIPSDLLSYAGADDASLDTKLQVVSGQVDGMLAMVEQQIEDQRVEAARVSVPEVRDYAPASSYSTTCALDDLLCIDEDEVACGAVIECESIAADPFADFTFCSDGIAPVALQEIQLPAEQPPAQPQQQQQQQQQQQESQQQQSQVSTGSTVTSRAHFDYSQLPEHLNRAFKRLDTDGALRPTIIKVGDGWTRKRQATLLSPVVSQSLSDDDKTTEKNQAFDLLDALSRSGSLPFDDASFHVVVASTHCFTKSVTDTVIQDNVNPIAKVERSALIVASTIQDCPTAQLVKDDQLSRVQAASPALF